MRVGTSFLDVQPRNPQVLDSEQEGWGDRAPASRRRATLRASGPRARLATVTDGEIEVTDSDGGTVTAWTGLLAIFDPNERHEVTAKTDARLLLVLSPWPGEGHPSNKS